MRRLNTLLEVQSARIAGALHDEASQCLASAHLAIADIALDVAPPVQARLQEVRLQLNEVAAQLRRLSHELHPTILDDLDPIDAIKSAARTFALWSARAFARCSSAKVSTWWAKRRTARRRCASPAS